MTLQDHFRPPLSLRRHWHAFHNAWATYLASHINRHLPEGYFAEPNVQFGIEIDVATFEEYPASRPSGREREPSLAVWTPPAPVQTIPFPFLADSVEVLVYAQEGGPMLAGAIELVSPSNKDRPEHREVFVTKCVGYLSRGLGLALIDIVTSRGGNFHKELLSRFGQDASAYAEGALYASAYRPVERDGPSLDLWFEALELGSSLPVMPLWLPGGICVPVDFDETYRRTCDEQRLPESE